MRKRGLTFADIGVLLLVVGVLAVFVFVPLHPRYRKASLKRVACANNLYQMGMVLKLYATENNGRFPFIDATKNNFSFEASAIFPEYLTDHMIVACPASPNWDAKTNSRLRANVFHPDSAVGAVHPDCFVDMGYCYLGWVVTSDEEADVFLAAYDRLSPEKYDNDVVVAEGRGNGGGNVIHRIQSDSARVLNDVSKSNHDIPVIWDNPRQINHEQIGGNVLYLDGHVEFIAYPGKFPMTETMARLLEERPRAPILDYDLPVPQP
ncbi:hypothetical protein HZA56_02245 [Candidatus Poribacteria bacterium]|nr:hypothetical protein [Candidatus Poribacteria bacterium]